MQIRWFSYISIVSSLLYIAFYYLVWLQVTIHRRTHQPTQATFRNLGGHLPALTWSIRLCQADWPSLAGLRKLSKQLTHINARHLFNRNINRTTRQDLTSFRQTRGRPGKDRWDLQYPIIFRTTDRKWLKSLIIHRRRLLAAWLHPHRTGIVLPTSSITVPWDCIRNRR